MIITPDIRSGGYSAYGVLNGRRLVAHGNSIAEVWQQFVELVADTINKGERK